MLIDVVDWVCRLWRVRLDLPGSPISEPHPRTDKTNPRKPQKGKHREHHKMTRREQEHVGTMRHYCLKRRTVSLHNIHTLAFRTLWPLALPGPGHTLTFGTF